MFRLPILFCLAEWNGASGLWDEGSEGKGDSHHAVDGCHNACPGNNLVLVFEEIIATME